MNQDSGQTEARIRAAFAASEPITRDWDNGPEPARDDFVTIARPRPPAWRRWQAPVLAAAIVAALAVTTVVLTQRGDPSGTPAAAPGSSSSLTSTSQSPGSQLRGSTPASDSTAPVVIRPGQTAHLGPPNPQVGVAYPFDLLTHCGIRATIFGGRQWQATHPQPDPPRLPDSHGVTHYDGYVSGTATLTDQSTLRFTVHDSESAANGQSYIFTPAKGPQPVCA